MVPRLAGFVVALTVVIAGAQASAQTPQAPPDTQIAASHLAAACVRSGAARLRSGVARRRWATAGRALHGGWLRGAERQPDQARTGRDRRRPHETRRAAAIDGVRLLIVGQRRLHRRRLPLSGDGRRRRPLRAGVTKRSRRPLADRRRSRQQRSSSSALSEERRARLTAGVRVTAPQREASVTASDTTLRPFSGCVGRLLSRIRPVKALIWSAES